MKKLLIIAAMIFPIYLSAGLLGVGVRVGGAFSKPVNDYELFKINETVSDTLIVEGDISQSDRDNIEKGEALLEWNAGITAAVYYDISIIPMTEMLNIRPELSFNQRKSKAPKEFMTAESIIELAGNVNSADKLKKYIEGWETETFNYVDVTLPVVVTLPIPGIDIYALAGVYGGFLINDVKGANSTEYGFTLGAGFGLDLSIINAGIEARYDRNISKIYDDGDDTVFHTITSSVYLEF